MKRLNRELLLQELFNVLSSSLLNDKLSLFDIPGHIRTANFKLYLTSLDKFKARNDIKLFEKCLDILYNDIISYQHGDMSRLRSIYESYHKTLERMTSTNE